jgi:hypothetical protein
MHRNHAERRRVVRGTALLVTLIFMAVFASLAVAVAVVADMNMTVSRNRLHRRQAEAFSEAGLQLVQIHLSGAPTPGTDSIEDLHEAIATHLAPVWSELAGDHDGAFYDAQEVLLSPVETTVGELGTGEIEVRISSDAGAADSPIITVESTGRFRNATVTAYYEFTALPAMTILGNYGIASKSAIHMKGNPSVIGANRTEEGSILSATEVTLDAIDLQGHVNITGDVAVTNPDASITTNGNVNIGGDEVYGAAEPQWPEVDTSVFEPFATNIYTGAEGDTLTNIRIPAGTNPTFNSDMHLQGVIYIESPNEVRFNGSCDVEGVIVAEKPLTENYDSNQIQFSGNVDAQGVEVLPNEPEFAALKELKGTFLLAEGWNLEFTGNFGVVNGYIVGSKFDFSGNAGGTIRGGIINLDDSFFEVDGDVDIIIDRDNAEDEPAGLINRYFLVCVDGSYHE